MKTIKENQKLAGEVLKKKFGFTSVMQSPRFTKVVVSTGVGSVKDKKKLELIADRMARITGQKAALRGSKKSIASFKVRQGDPVGYQVTLRGERMYDFIDKLLNIALPRTKDFRGISRNGIDNMGNYSLGIKENTIFPENTDEELKDVFGVGVTFVTTSKKPEHTLAFLEALNFPFKKEEKSKK